MKIVRLLSSWGFATAILIGLILLMGPWFIRVPIWVDVTYHDVSAWNILHGGIHYKDVFETNLPGMVWIHAILRPIIGTSQEAIRLVDLGVLAGIIFLLSRLLNSNGISLVQRIWFAVAVVLFYFGETEFIHVQRDGWMLFPATLATWLHVRNVKSPHFPRAILEGFLWGLAVWIKPHVIVPALAVWLVSWKFIALKPMLRLSLGLLVGGLIAGFLGTVWLIATGTWKPMWEVLLHWNGEYYQWSWEFMELKIRATVSYFAAFSLSHYLAIPLGIVSLCRKKPEQLAQQLLIGFYFGWLFQAVAIQKQFDYAHSPPTILAIAVLASFRIPVGPIFLFWCLGGSYLVYYHGESELFVEAEKLKPHTVRMLIPNHPILSPKRLGLWARSWSDGSMELKDRLTYYHDIHCAPDWGDLEHVAEFLRSKQVGDDELICWHDSTHPLYVWLNVRPGLRFPHVMTVMKFRSKLPSIRNEVMTSPAKYIVADLIPCSYMMERSFPSPPPAGPVEQIPAEFPEWGKHVFPWNQRPIFRAGRYFVFEFTQRTGDIEFPLPEGLKD